MGNWRENCKCIWWSLARLRSNVFVIKPFRDIECVICILFKTIFHVFWCHQRSNSIFTCTFDIAPTYYIKYENLSTYWWICNVWEICSTAASTVASYLNYVEFIQIEINRYAISSIWDEICICFRNDMSFIDNILGILFQQSSNLLCISSYWLCVTI